MSGFCTQTDINRLVDFQGDGLTSVISDIEAGVKGNGLDAVRLLCDRKNINTDLLGSLTNIKLMASKIHIALHAAGILIALQSILLRDEVIESLSLGAGNTGKHFDLTTNLRIAEFKFIDWKGGPESVRQNSLFKDYFYLAETNDSRIKQLYVGDTKVAAKFLNSRRNLSSIMSKNSKLLHDFNQIDGYGGIKTVGEYYRKHSGEVKLIELYFQE